MDGLIGIAIAVVVWALSGSLASKKKGSKVSTGTSTLPKQRPTVMEELERMLRESMGGEDETVLPKNVFAETLADESAAEHEAETISGNRDSLETEESRGYYTYEDEGMVEAQRRVKEAMSFQSYEKGNARTLQETVEAENLDADDTKSDCESFDLRQAFIYNTILQNRYIPELN